MKSLILKIKKANSEGRLSAAIKSKAHPCFSAGLKSFLNHEFVKREEYFKLLFRSPDIWSIHQDNKID